MGTYPPLEFYRETMKFGSLEYWRTYFGTANSDIFDIIDYAIMVAASDCPKEFVLRRDGIAERLFSCGLTPCVGGDRLDSVVSGEDHGRMNKNQVSNFNSGQTDQIEDESMMVAGISMIKVILRYSNEETDSVLLKLLRRLQQLALTVDLLKETGIGKAVNPLKKHVSEEIRKLARTLIDGWKAMVDEWIKSTEATEVNPSVIDEEEGLTSPPQSKSVYVDSSPGRRPKCNTGPKMLQKQETSNIITRPLVSDDVSVQAKLEATKRKLHESYQQVAKAKKQRTVRVIELRDLPKQGNGLRNPHSKLWKALGRRKPCCCGTVGEFHAENETVGE